MTVNKFIGFISLSLFGSILLQAGELRNPSFEEAGDWKIVKQGERLQAAFDDIASQDGKKGFTVSLPDATRMSAEDFAGIAQVLELSNLEKGVSFYVKDDYTGDTKGYHWMQLLLDGEVIWEVDVAGGDTQWRKVSLDLTRYLEEP